MTLHIAFSEIDGPLVPAAAFTPVTNRKRAHVRAALRRGHDIDAASVPFPAPMTTGWACAFLQAGPATLSVSSHLEGDNYVFGLQDQNGAVIGGCIGGNVNNKELYVNAKWLGSPLIISTDTSAGVFIVIHWNIDDTNGFFRVYVDNAEFYSYAGDTTPDGAESIAALRLDRRISADVYENRFHAVSEIMVADTPLIGARLVTLPLEVTGTVNDWEGDVSDIIAFNADDSAGIHAEVDGDTITREAAELTVLGEGEYVAGVVITALARVAEDADVEFLEGVARVSDTNYTTGSPTSPEVGYAGQTFVFEQDPDTSTFWTLSGINGAEFGFRVLEPAP